MRIESKVKKRNPRTIVKRGIEKGKSVWPISVWPDWAISSKFLGHKFAFKRSLNIHCLMGPFRKHHFWVKTNLDTFRQLLKTFGLLFNSNIRSHCRPRMRNREESEIKPGIIATVTRAVWPDKNPQMSIKVAQIRSHKKNELFWHLYKNWLTIWAIWV